MSKEDLTQDEMAALPHRSVIFDADNDPLVKLSQGWVYQNLLPSTMEEQAALSLNFFIRGRGPQAYPPYALQKKVGVR